MGISFYMELNLFEYNNGKGTQKLQELLLLKPCATTRRSLCLFASCSLYSSAT